MLGHILCPSCGNNIGEIMLFTKMAMKGCLKQHMGASYANYSPDMLNHSSVTAPSMNHILDAVGIPKERMCCRIHIMGAKREPE